MFQPMPEQSQVVEHYWTLNCTMAAVAVVASLAVAVGVQPVAGTAAAAVAQLAFEVMHQRQGWPLSFAFAIVDSATVAQIASLDFDLNFLAAVHASDFATGP